MPQKPHGAYPPLNTLKPVAKDVWIVDGPLIRFGMPWPKMPFPTRMTVIRLSGGGLFIHSPTPLVPELKGQLEDLGAPRWIIGPNRIHYWWIPEWRNAYPEAEIHLAPGIREQAKGRIDFPAHELSAEDGYPWDGALATLPVSGRYMTEVEFFHHASRTLVLTDLIENFEPARLDGFIMRWLTWLGGVQDPHGGMPRDMRMTFSRNREGLKAAVEKMIAWNPERIILAHGRWYMRNGAAELQRAFAWLMK
ncbi:DUF4336 domain-containing protein [Chelativorans sp. AA-79]|uniref:DUF4336 domain-containing protein n=1 Tax=Chelativorans sp. AA-79 TaxID=3028735 RepID=UPI0023FA0C17|nr:DUF4336 domain-containing protein [Chelativorans sp. AA-79]WEX10559.1 DUF4336 domain-containing protein [Chelativorans sp. AA-79]